MGKNKEGQDYVGVPEGVSSEAIEKELGKESGATFGAAKSLFQERIKSGDKTPELQEFKAISDEACILNAQIGSEKNPEVKAILEKKLDDLKKRFDDAMFEEGSRLVQEELLREMTEEELDGLVAAGFLKDVQEERRRRRGAG